MLAYFGDLNEKSVKEVEQTKLPHMADASGQVNLGEHRKKKIKPLNIVQDLGWI